MCSDACRRRWTRRSSRWRIAVCLRRRHGAHGARWRGTATEAGVDLFKGVALAIPDFLWGLIFILLFGVAIPIFDISGPRLAPLELPFVTPFYLIESIARLALRSHRPTSRAIC